ncbi:P-loop containing nucleoside triphosphate hydrolase protein, partial [Ascobolus immersus RN42]
SERKAKAEERKQLEHAIVMRKHFTHKGALSSSEMVINSRHILSVLPKVVKYYPRQPDLASVGLTISHPFGVLFHHWEELERFEEEEDLDATTRLHLNFLLSVLDSECKEERKRLTRITSTGHITFSLLWCIYKPGDLVYAPGKNELYRFTDFMYDADPMGDYFCAMIERSNFDGVKAGRESTSLRVYERELGGSKGIKAITNLKFFPLKFTTSEFQQQIVAECTARGLRSRALRDVTVKRYSGAVEALRRPPHEFFSADRSDYSGQLIEATVEGRVIIDALGFHEENYGYRPTQTWESDDPSLLPRDVFGFAPGGKLWCRLNVDLIRDPVWDSDAFGKLVLPNAPKRVIKALASSHQWPEGSTRDAQAAKGKGLVILLHGAPGTGKTMTAETVAEHTNRALVVISSGELGTEVDQINSNLDSFLQNAARWKAVVLIDEADVFLEKRLSHGANRLEQNGLVAVFLRHLEYFQGILFLTSNRDKDFDPAIKSRIHLSLKFSPPDRRTRQTLWKQALSAIPPEEVGYDLEAVLELVDDMDLNGREISNAIRTMRTLAR